VKSTTTGYHHEQPANQTVIPTRKGGNANKRCRHSSCRCPAHTGCQLGRVYSLSQLRVTGWLLARMKSI
jgi:hypothetical protein